MLVMEPSSTEKARLANLSLLNDEQLDELERLINDDITDRAENPYYFFKPLKKQKEFKDCPAKTKALFGGNQSGKTTTGAHTVIEKCLDNPDQRWWCGAETWELSRLVQQGKINEMLPLDQLEYAHYTEENGFRHNIVRFKNGSSISFRSYDQERKRWQGATLHGIWLDEEPPWDIYQECLPRLAKNNGLLLVTMTSLTGYTRFVEEIVLGKKRGIICFFISTYDNHVKYGGVLTDEALQRLEDQIEEKDRKARLHGIPTPKTGMVFENFSMQKPHVIPYNEEFEPRSDWPTLVSIDPHPRTPHGVLWMHIDPQSHIWVFNERPWLKNEDSHDKTGWVDLERFSQEVLSFNHGLKIEGTIIDKHAANTRNAVTGTTIKDELVANGLYAQDAGGDVEAKIVILQRMFRQGKIHIFNSCWNLLWELQRYVWEPHITQKVADRREEKQTPRKKNDHLIDCLMNGVLHLSQMGILERNHLVSRARNPAGKDVVNHTDLHRNPNQAAAPALMEFYE